MSERVLVGYFIRRTWKKPPRDGQTLFAESHRIYDEREHAQDDLDRLKELGRTDKRFDYDIAEAWMHADTETKP